MAKDENEKCCENCEWFELSDLKGFGYCRRYAPRTPDRFLNPPFPEYHYRGVWCGEFERKTHFPEGCF